MTMSEAATAIGARTSGWKQPGAAGPLRAAGASDRGRIRLNNEDRFHIDAGRGIYFVVDGVGGHAAGEVAADIACDVIVRRLERTSGTIEQRVREAITLANNEIFRQASSSAAYAGMTCVVTVAVVDGHRLTIGHVGDTRLYLVSPRGISKVTHDHSPVGEREDAREISERDAMRHPRRNEVFRDVGSVLREPDDPDFIELVQARLDADAAVLLCSDGLTDMLETRAIDRLVRRHAGDAGRVVRALVEAANDAGGLDNVTAVYVEGDRFAAAAREAGPPAAAPGTGLGARTRAAWMATGALLGLALGLALPLLPAVELPLLPRRARTLSVGGSETSPFATVGAALLAARPGDIVQLEPGEYVEAVVLPDRVHLAARESGTAVLAAPAGRPDWVALTIEGRSANRVSGIRVLGRPEAPMAFGVRAVGGDVVIDDVTVEGTIGVGLHVEGEGSVLVRASRFVGVTGVPVRIGRKAEPVVRQTVFERPAGAEPRAAFEIDPDARPALIANLLVGYHEGLRDPSAEWTPTRIEQLFRGNYRARAAQPVK